MVPRDPKLTAPGSAGSHLPVVRRPTDTGRGRSSLMLVTIINSISACSVLLAVILGQPVLFAGVVGLLVGLATAANRIEEIGEFLKASSRGRLILGLQLAVPAGLCSLMGILIIIGSAADGFELKGMAAGLAVTCIFGGIALSSIGLVTGHVTVDAFVGKLKKLGGSGLQR